MPACAAENDRDRLAEESNPTWLVREVVKDLTHEGFLTSAWGRGQTVYGPMATMNHHSSAHQRILCDAAKPGVHPDAYRRGCANPVVAG
jgi:hypothetical protein